MADTRSKRTGEHNGQIIKLISDAAQMREHIDALEARILRLESELGTLRHAAAAAGPARTTKSPPAPVRPPPLPRMSSQMSAAAAKPAGRRSIVDISEIAELVESMPPPAPRPRK